ncbi:hypothetical protein [Haloarcula montana]|uniref:hypothetical protein n=1 Tax=Haloarcula montana TaxID=3111776 RepID=UPI002D77E3E8|nr:hypothetical protein [Haloarcula sp. GH36]
MFDTTQRHAAHDAPNSEEFDRLLSATYLGEDDYETELEDRFITIGSGWLTLRKGELLHFRPEWLDRNRKLILVPAHEDCFCEYCLERAEEYADEKDISVEEALEFCWSPKTEASVRAIYYGWCPETIIAVEQFADEVGELDMCASTINNRVDKLAERAYVDDIYPHALRAHSALFWADVGLEAAYLQAIMGWKSIEVAVAYLRASGQQLAQRIERAFTLESRERPDPVPREDLTPPSDDAVEAAEDVEDERTTPSIREWEDPEKWDDLKAGT